MHTRMDRRTTAGSSPLGAPAGDERPSSARVLRPRPLAAAFCCAFLALASMLGGGALVGCAAPAKQGGNAAAAEPRALRVRWRIYASGQDLALASQGAQDRTETYSKAVAIADAGTKIAPDEVVAALIEYLDDNGPRFQPGNAPAAGGAFTQSIEVDEPGGKRHIAVGKSSPLDDQKRFQECWKAFAAVYNQTYQLQTVDEAPDWQRQNDVLKAQKARRSP